MVNTIEQLSKRDKEWRRIAFSLCTDRMLADDLVQNMYIRIYESGKEWNEIKDKQEFYVYICLRNLFFNHVKKENKIEKIRLNESQEIPFHEKYDVKEFNELLKNEMMNITFKKREAMELNIIDGKSMRWIAGNLDMSLNDVFKYCKTGRELLAVNFKKYYDEFKN